MVEVYLGSDGGVSVPNNEEKKRYRWYACMETAPLTWRCVHVREADDALNLRLQNTNTKAVMVSKWIPKIFDPLYLHRAIHPRIKINM